MALINEIGNIYGYLTVIERAENDKEGKARWLCRCKCGNEVIVRGKSLRQGNTKSCGCYQKERAAESNMKRGGDLTGQRFGKLVVLEHSGFITHPNGKRNRLWKCQCDCGNICEVQHQYLTYGDTTSCGCMRSKGEFQIAQLLKEHNIKFEQEYTFENLKDKYPLRFDFAIFDKNNKLKLLIEYQGEQHWCKSNGFYSEDIVRHDEMKREYCKNNNIKLLEIKYKKDYNIKYEDLQLEEIINEL